MTADFGLQRSAGPVYVLNVQTDKAREWANENIDVESAYCAAIWLEMPYLQRVIDNLTGDGLTWEEAS